MRHEFMLTQSLKTNLCFLLAHFILSLNLTSAKQKLALLMRGHFSSTFDVMQNDVTIGIQGKQYGCAHDNKYLTFKSFNICGEK